MILDLYDNNVEDPVKGRMKSPTHCAIVAVDYEYQAEQYVIEAEEEYPWVVRCVC